MFVEYKCFCEDESTEKDFFDFCTSHFEKHDDQQLIENISLTIQLMNNIMNTKDNYLFSEEFYNNVKKLTILIEKVDLKNVNIENIRTFFEYIFKISGGNNSKYIQKDENLFLALVDLILSFVHQDSEKIIYELFRFDFLKYTHFLIDNSFNTRRDKEVYEALAIVSTKFPKSRRMILNSYPIEQLYRMVCFFNPPPPPGMCINPEKEKYLEQIFKLLASFSVQDNLNEKELINCMKIYKYSLFNNYVNLYKATAIGLYVKIKKLELSFFEKLKNPLKEICELLIERMNENPVICQYTFYIASKLLLSGINISVNYAYFQNFIVNSVQKVQLASLYFFASISKNPQILISQNLDIIKFVWNLHVIYSNSSFVVKEYLDEVIFLYLNHKSLYDVKNLFKILENGFMETLILIIQTRKKDLYSLINFLYELFSFSKSYDYSMQLSFQFSDLGGFDVLREFYTDPRFSDRNEDNAKFINTVRKIIEEYEPKSA